MYTTTKMHGPALAGAAFFLALPLGWVSGPAKAQAPEPLLTLRGHSEKVRRVCFSADGKRLATAGADKIANLWDAATGKKLHTLKGHGGLAFNKDGTLLATASGDSSVKIWDTDTGRETMSLDGHNIGVFAVAFRPGSNQVFSGDIGVVDQAKEKLTGEIKVWNATTGKLNMTLRAHTNAIISLAFSKDGRRFASGSVDGSVVVWEVASGKVALTLRGHESTAFDVAFSPDSKRLATANDGGTIEVWELPSDKAALTLKGHQSRVVLGRALAVQFSPDGKVLASAGNRENQDSGGWVGQVKLWDAANGKELLVLEGTKEEQGAYSAAFSPDGKHLATAHGDGTVRVWDVAKLLQGQP